MAKLRDLNRQLVEDCVVEVADNTKLEGDFKMAMAIVEGYNINMEKPWCAPFAWSEPVYTRKVRTAHSLNHSPQIREKQLLRITKAKYNITM